MVFLFFVLFLDKRHQQIGIQSVVYTGGFLELRRRGRAVSVQIRGHDIVEGQFGLDARHRLDYVLPLHTHFQHLRFLFALVQHCRPELARLQELVVVIGGQHRTQLAHIWHSNRLGELVLGLEVVPEVSRSYPFNLLFVFWTKVSSTTWDKLAEGRFIGLNIKEIDLFLDLETTSVSDNLC